MRSRFVCELQLLVANAKCKSAEPVSIQRARTATLETLLLIQDCFNQIDKIALAEAEFDRTREHHDIAPRHFTDEDIAALESLIDPLPAGSEKIMKASDEVLTKISALLADLTCIRYWKRCFESQLTNMGYYCDTAQWKIKKSDALQILRLRDHALTSYEENRDSLFNFNGFMCTRIEQQLNVLEDFGFVYNWPADRTSGDGGLPPKPDPVYKVRQVTEMRNSRGQMAMSYPKEGNGNVSRR